MSHEFPETLRGQSKATGEKDIPPPGLMLPVLVLLPGGFLAAGEDAVGCCRRSWPLPVSPPPPIRAPRVRRREKRQPERLRAPPPLAPFLRLCSACQASLSVERGEPALRGHGSLRPSDAGISPTACPRRPGPSP